MEGTVRKLLALPHTNRPSFLTKA